MIRANPIIELRSMKEKNEVQRYVIYALEINGIL
jgi:hypothetical protein